MQAKHNEHADSISSRIHTHDVCSLDCTLHATAYDRMHGQRGQWRCPRRACPSSPPRAPPPAQASCPEGQRCLTGRRLQLDGPCNREAKSLICQRDALGSPSSSGCSSASSPPHERHGRRCPASHPNSPRLGLLGTLGDMHCVLKK